MKHKKTKIVVALSVLLLSMAQFAHGDGCGTKPGPTTEYVTFNFCNTTAPTCSEILYEPDQQFCVSGNPNDDCLQDAWSGEEIYYAGTCSSSGGCNLTNNGQVSYVFITTVGYSGTCGG